jgi:hypothetical protein
MERPDIGKPFIGPEKPGKQLRLIATTRSLEEANRLAEQYELQGFDTRIVKKTQGGLSVYEVWIGKNEVLG